MLVHQFTSRDESHWKALKRKLSRRLRLSATLSGEQIRAGSRLWMIIVGSAQIAERFYGERRTCKSRLLVMSCRLREGCQQVFVRSGFSCLQA